MSSDTKRIRTDRELKALKPQNKKYRRAVYSRYGGGLCVIVLPSGSIQFIYRYRRPHDAKQVEVILPAATLATARDSHLQCIEWVKNGKNPAQEFRRKHRQNADAITMNQLFDSWLQHYARTPTKATKLPPIDITVTRQQERWNLYLKDSIGHCLARDVERWQLITELEEISKRAREEARKVLSIFRGMLDYALDRSLVKDNVARSIDAGRVGLVAGRPRERVLSMDELKQLWHAIDGSDHTIITKTALKVLIITGCRRCEVAGARWDEINLGERTWYIHAMRMKNRQSHQVFISDLFLREINELKRLTFNSGFLFPSIKHHEDHIHPDSLTTALKRLQIEMNRKILENDPQGRVIPQFTLHDLRRTARTAWSHELKIQPHVAEAMLSHLPSMLIRTYDKATYWDEQVSAWCEWSVYLTSLFYEDKISNTPTIVGL